MDWPWSTSGLTLVNPMDLQAWWSYYRIPIWWPLPCFSSVVPCILRSSHAQWLLQVWWVGWLGKLERRVGCSFRIYTYNIYNIHTYMQLQGVHVYTCIVWLVCLYKIQVRVNMRCINPIFNNQKSKRWGGGFHVVLPQTIFNMHPLKSDSFVALYSLWLTFVLPVWHDSNWFGDMFKPIVFTHIFIGEQL